MCGRRKRIKSFPALCEFSENDHDVLGPLPRNLENSEFEISGLGTVASSDYENKYGYGLVTEPKDDTYVETKEDKSLFGIVMVRQFLFANFFQFYHLIQQLPRPSVI